MAKLKKANALNAEAQIFIYYNKKAQQTVCKECGAIFEELAPLEEKKFEKARKQG